MAFRNRTFHNKIRFTKPPMDKQLLLEKIQFTLQYFGQEVLVPKHRMDPIVLTGIDLHAIEDGHLRLKNLSSITDEDAIEVIKLCEGYVSEDLEFRIRHGESFASPKIWKQAYYIHDGGGKEERTVIVANFSDTRDGIDICNGNEYWRCHIKALDCLRSKGYALPYKNISVDEQISLGWTKTY